MSSENGEEDEEEDNERMKEKRWKEKRKINSMTNKRRTKRNEEDQGFKIKNICIKSRKKAVQMHYCGKRLEARPTFSQLKLRDSVLADDLGLGRQPLQQQHQLNPVVVGLKERLW